MTAAGFRPEQVVGGDVGLRVDTSVNEVKVGLQWMAQGGVS